MRIAVELPPWQARVSGWLTAVVPKYRQLVPGQIDALEAIDRLGVRLDTYATICVPVLVLGGDRSPTHLAERLDAIERVIPHAERIVMPGRDHAADVKHPGQIADIVATFAQTVTR